MEESRGNHVDWNRVIYGSLFELLKKNRAVRHQGSGSANDPERISRGIPQTQSMGDRPVSGRSSRTQSLDRRSSPTYVLSTPDTSDTTWRVLRAAHKYSTIREVEMIRRVNEPSRLVDIDHANSTRISKASWICADCSFSSQSRFHTTSSWKSRKLRFQTRWNQTPRVPRTSVLGHSYFVAALTLLMSRDIGCSSCRTYNNFFLRPFSRSTGSCYP